MNLLNWKRGLMALLGLALLSIGAGRCPYGGAAGLPLSLVGCAMCVITSLSVGESGGTNLQRGLRAAFAAVGVLFQWGGTLAAATAVAGGYYARSHHTPYTGMIEVVVAGIGAVVAPLLLTFGAAPWREGSRRSLALLWGYWLAFYPVTIIAAAVSQPWTDA